VAMNEHSFTFATEKDNKNIQLLTLIVQMRLVPSDMLHQIYNDGKKNKILIALGAKV